MLRQQEIIHRRLFVFLVFTALVCFAGTGHSGEKTEKTKQEMQELSKDTKRGAKRAIRDVKDSTCETFNGKIECAGKKAKHTIQNASDKTEDKLD